MILNKRDYYKSIATETLEIINTGYYINRNKEIVNIKNLVDKAIEDTELIVEQSRSEEDKVKESSGYFSPNLINTNTPDSLIHSVHNPISIIKSTTIDTIIGIRKKVIEGNIISLNFASAMNPGGGFQRGANAQEESIARASALYPCLIKNKEFYEYNRKQGSPLYSHWMIYSPDVPVFRDDKGNLLPNPILCSFITAPAVNAKVARERGINDEVIKGAMTIRIRSILELALSKQPKAIILGAFGCGVFGNHPEDVARIFAIELMKVINKIKGIEIIFAIYDKDEDMIKVFSKELKCLI